MLRRASVLVGTGRDASGEVVYHAPDSLNFSSATASNQTLGTIIQIDATSAGKSIDFTVTNASGNCAGLMLSLSTATAII